MGHKIGGGAVAGNGEDGESAVTGGRLLPDRGNSSWGDERSRALLDPGPARERSPVR
ncbi:hypothetical protein ABZ078_38260 [Streptomyces sp. NPDC006385]|uniref:hypothetical protein n=1 Tax=Streptomyces sp. NPDC006385 TaxID=3156761 RepID=UPI0033AD3961